MVKCRLLSDQQQKITPPYCIRIGIRIQVIHSDPDPVNNFGFLLIQNRNSDIHITAFLFLHKHELNYCNCWGIYESFQNFRSLIPDTVLCTEYNVFLGQQQQMVLPNQIYHHHLSLHDAAGGGVGEWQHFAIFLGRPPILKGVSHVCVYCSYLYSFKRCKHFKFFWFLKMHIFLLYNFSICAISVKYKK